jgi:formylglycine-generating enzyme required for sulfatase activity
MKSTPISGMYMKPHLFLSLLIILLIFNSGCIDNNPISIDTTDTKAPTVSILYPVNNSTIKSDTTYTVIADANDNKGVSFIDFYIDGSKVGSDSSSPYQYSWNTTGKAGDHSIMAKAFDATGNSASSAVIAMKVKVGANDPPDVPSNPSPVKSATGVSMLSPTLSWSCSDPEGDAITYDVFFGTSYPPTTQVATGQNDTSFACTGLADNTTYYWKVNAKDSKDASTTGSVWSFTTGSGVILPSMVQVAGGSFVAGTTPVTISSFKIDKYEVTYELWTDVRNWALTHGYTDLVAGTNNPVTMVKWYDIVKWCNARSEKDGLTPVYYTDSTQATVYRTGEIAINLYSVKWNVNGYRLPTSTEWEFAARGGNSTHGYTYSGSNNVESVAWYSSNSGSRTHTVGEKSANELGIHDMSGNVREWCGDFYDGDVYPSGGTTDPKGPAKSNYSNSIRVMRCGAFVDSKNYNNVTFRSSLTPNYGDDYIGFRSCTKDNPTSTDTTDTQAPTVSILYPVNGSAINADTTYTIIADANDNKGVSSVDFYIDGDKVSSVSSSPYQFLWNTTGKAGDHSIMAKAFDAAGNTASSRVIAVKVNNSNNPQSVPSNPSPANAATDVSTSPTFTWSYSDSIGEPITYDVFFGTSNPPTAQIAAGQSAASLACTGLASSTTYYWKVNAKNIWHGSTTGPVWSFTTRTNIPPAVPSNPSPANAATRISTYSTLTWSCSDPEWDAITYDVFLGTSNPPTTQVATGQSAASFSCTDLANSTTYYWQVNAKDSKNASTTGSIWSFTTGTNNPPNMPSTPSPANTATEIPNSPTLSWGCSDPDNDKITYDIFVGTSNPPTTQVAAGQSASSFACTGLAYSTTYFWQVNATDSRNATTIGSVWSFTIKANSPPAVPSNPWPINSQIEISSSPTLSWSCSDPDNDKITYDVFFGTSNPPTAQVATGQSAASFACTGLTDNTIYYWQVKAKDSKDASTTGSIWSFTTGSGIISPSMVQVGGGTFTAGSTPVTISSFTIDKYEVTYEQWTAVRTWALMHGYTDLAAGTNGWNSTGKNNPVTNVNWYDVVKWCNARSEKDGFTPVYYTDNTQATVYRTGEIDINLDAVKWDVNGYRLPTETEWEFAARGGNSTHGYDYSGSNTLVDVAWYNFNSGNTNTVGTKSANELGIYDMSGNVAEWCWDWFDMSSAYPVGGTTDPRGPSSKIYYRMYRGGESSLGEYYCRVVARCWPSPGPNVRRACTGFRCVQK